MIKRIILIIITSFVLMSCLSQEAVESKNEKSDEVISYMEEKYHQNLELEKSGYITNNSSLFVTKSQNMYFRFTNGMTAIFYAKENKFVDNGQAILIVNDLKEKLWNPIFDDIEYHYAKEPIFNEYQNVDEYKGNYFHEYYDGNIEDYIKKEKIIVQADVFVISHKKDWKDKMERISDAFYESFEHYHHGVNLIAMSDDCYKKYKQGVYRYPSIALDECFAQYELSQTLNRYVQNFIPLSQGVYATSAQKNFILEEGDLKLEREVSQKELLDMKEEEKYEYDMKSDVFKIKLSQRVKKQMDSFGFDVYIKCNTDELSISDKNRLYYTQYKDNKYGTCFMIHSDLSDSEFHSIKEDNRYWIGIKVKK